LARADLWFLFARPRLTLHHSTPCVAYNPLLYETNLAQTLLEPINKAPAPYVAIRLGDFAEGVYFPHLETKRRASTLRGYRQMWNRYLQPRCANLVMHDAETRTVQVLLDTISTEDKLAPQTMAHIKHLIGGMFRFAIAQGHLPRGTINPVTGILWLLLRQPERSQPARLKTPITLCKVN
jgi:hypothetical protein